MGKSNYSEAQRARLRDRGMVEVQAIDIAGLLPARTVPQPLVELSASLAPLLLPLLLPALKSMVGQTVSAQLDKRARAASSVGQKPQRNR